VKVKNEWSCTSAPPVCLHGVNRKFYLLSCLLFFGVAFFTSHFMIICVTNIFNFSVFTLINGYLMLVSAIVDGNMVKCCVWPKVKSVIHLQLSHIFVT
jgi:hypothetical protein